MAEHFTLVYLVSWFILLSKETCWGLQIESLSGQIQENNPNMEIPGNLNSEKDTSGYKFPLAIRQLILHSLSKEINNAKVNESKTALLYCNNHISKLILKRFPEAKFQWIHNNKRLLFKGLKYTLKNGDLQINYFKSLDDSGVYICQMVRKQMWKVTLKIYSLTVAALSPKDFPESHFPSGSTIKINCNSEILGDLYHGSTKKWTINGKEMKLADRANHYVLDTVSSVEETQSGIWICMVLRRDNPKTFWITNKLNIVIDPPETFWQIQSKSHYFPFMITNIVGSTFTGLFLLLFVGGSIVLGYGIKKRT